MGQELKRCERKFSGIEKENRNVKAELEEKRNEYQNLQRKFSHLQRDTDNARTIEQNMSKFLKNMYTNSTASTNSNNNGVAIESLPRISISSVTSTSSSGKKRRPKSAGRPRSARRR